MEHTVIHGKQRDSRYYILIHYRPQDNAVQDNNTVTDFYLSHSPSRYLSHLNNLFFSKIISTVTVWQIILTFKLYESKLENHPYSFTLKDCKRLRASILSLFFLFLYLGYKNESLWIWQKIDLEKPENVSLKY